MLTTVHHWTRRASRERRMAREALTEAARTRHAALADHFTRLAESEQQGPMARQALAPGASEGR